MKKIVVFLAVLIMSVTLAVSAFASEQPTIYVSPLGNDASIGTFEQPVKTLYAAFRALPNGGKIVVSGAVTVDTTVLPETSGLITITSVDDFDYRASAGLGGSGIIYLKGNVSFSGPVKIENLDILATVKNLVFTCNGNYAYFGEGITVTTSSEDVTLPGIVAGRSGATPADGTYLEICSGSWNRVRAGSRGTSSAAQTGDACLVIRGGEFQSTIDGGGDSATDGNVYMFIYGGTFNASVNGASAAEITGNLHMSFYGGTFNTKNVRIGRGGAIGGDVTVNLFVPIGQKFASGTSVVAGYVNGYVDASIDVNTDINPYYVSGNDLEALKAADEEFIESVIKAKLPENTSVSFSDRDSSASGTVQKTAFASFRAGDVNADGRISLADALKTVSLVFTHSYNKDADTNSDGIISLIDFVTLIKATLDNKTFVAADAKANIISDSLSLFGGAKAEDGKISKGYAFGTVTENVFSLYSTVDLSNGGICGLYFGASEATPNAKSGYYFEIDTNKKTLSLYNIVNGLYRLVAEENLNLLSNRANIRVTCGKSTNKDAAVLYFEDNGLVAEAYPRFDLSLPLSGNAVGLYIENGSATLPVCVKEEVPTTGNYYQNNLFEQFTDPEVFYENGVYYFYGTRSSTQNQGVQCFSSTDFVNWKDEGFVLKHGDAFGDGVYKAANIVKYGDCYYLFYMAKSDALGTSVTAYASAKSPVGPFSNSEKKALTGDSNFIGGQPFVDDDGQVYLIYARTTGGNKLYGAKITLKDGKATINLTTEKLLLEPSEPWENAKASVVECGYLVKHEGIYYLLYSGGNYNSTYGTGYATSESPLGPFVKYEYNPILASNDQAFGVGAATIFVSPDGSEHFIAYLRNFSPTVARPLLTCVDRIRFVDNPSGGPDIIEMYGPTVNPQPLPSGLGSVTAFPNYQTARFHW